MPVTPQAIQESEKCLVNMFRSYMIVYMSSELQEQATTQRAKHPGNKCKVLHMEVITEILLHFSCPEQCQAQRSLFLPSDLHKSPGSCSTLTPSMLPIPLLHSSQSCWACPW